MLAISKHDTSIVRQSSYASNIDCGMGEGATAPTHHMQRLDQECQCRYYNNTIIAYNYNL